MGKKGNWFSAVKRFFTCCSKPVNEGEKKRLKNGLSFIPSFREPSSIEEILGGIDHQPNNLFIQPQPQPQPQPLSQLQAQPPSSSSPPKITSPPKTRQTPEQHFSATRIQAAYRGYMARRRVTGLARVQKVLTSQNVRRQTVNAVKQMQLLVRVQTQIRSQRIQMLQSQAHKPQPSSKKSDKQSEMGDEYWDDSLITKEEKEARLKKKEDAAIKRERAMTYAYFHQVPPTLKKDSAHQTSLIPWWWKWLDPQLPYHVQKSHQFPTTSSRSTHKQLDSPTSSNRSINYSRVRKGASFYPKKDDDSLMSCPPFSVPNYMSPTASARAKARPASNPKERRTNPSTPRSQSSTRRFSFPFTPNTKSPGSSVGHLSIDSAVGRKPFNRFV